MNCDYSPPSYDAVVSSICPSIACKHIPTKYFQSKETEMSMKMYIHLMEIGRETEGTAFVFPKDCECVVDELESDDFECPIMASPSVHISCFSSILWISYTVPMSCLWTQLWWSMTNIYLLLLDHILSVSSVDDMGSE